MDSCRQSNVSPHTCKRWYFYIYPYEYTIEQLEEDEKWRESTSIRAQRAIPYLARMSIRITESLRTNR
jgi:hypothetical protein